METTKDTPVNFGQRLVRGFRHLLHQIHQFFHRLKVKFLTNFARWSDPKLEPYRKKPSRQTQTPPNSSTATISTTAATSPASTITDSRPDHPDSTNKNTNTQSAPAVPQTTAEFLELMRHTPRHVLSQRERHVIATIMNFPDTKVSTIMLPQSAITYVHDDEVLGPLTLDRLYRSGFQHFPVLDSHRRIVGLIHTTALNSLEIRETSRARDILDPKVYYLREDYTLNQALAAFLRTNCYFFLVVNYYERTVGLLTYQMLVDYLLGETPEDNFDRDDDRLAVAKRKL